ncbi:MAG: 2Fe-2S iron-sulfur cluster-binding protein [Candidatus Eisenbacteria bacterium]
MAAFDQGEPGESQDQGERSRSRGQEGLNLIEAARVASVEDPPLLLPPGLGVDGNCRMCLIEIDGIGKPQIACNSYAKDGLSFRTNHGRSGDAAGRLWSFSS